MSNDEIELAALDARDLIDALTRYRFARRRDQLLRRENPQDIWAIGENDRELLPLPYRIEMLHRRLRRVADALGLTVRRLTKGHSAESVEEIEAALAEAQTLQSRLAVRS